jgi:hypothetical protein
MKERITASKIGIVATKRHGISIPKAKIITYHFQFHRGLGLGPKGSHVSPFSIWVMSSPFPTVIEYDPHHHLMNKIQRSNLSFYPTCMHHHTYMYPFPLETHETGIFQALLSLTHTYNTTLFLNFWLFFGFPLRGKLLFCKIPILLNEITKYEININCINYFNGHE